MPKKIQLSIPKPCHEDWNAMTTVEKGKFCGSCQKQVVDFSNMNDRQVAEFFKKPSTGSVCGRFMTDQLDREIEIPRKRIPWLKYFFTIALPAFIVSLKASGSKTQGQPQVRKINADTTRKSIYDDVKMMGMVSRPQSIKPFMGDTVVVPENKPVVEDTIPVCTKPVMGKPSFIETIKGEISQVNTENQNVLWGKVIDEMGAPVAGASIIIKGTRIGVASNNNGEFRIKVNKGDTLLVYGVATDRTEVLVRDWSFMTIEVKHFVLFGLVVNKKASKYKKNRIKDIEKNIKEATLPTIRVTAALPASFKIFPNPVPSGSNITIEWKQTEEGYYSLQLINITGQAVHQKEIWIDGEARLLNFDLPAVAAGSYFLCITNKKTSKMLTEKIIVQ